ncbi:MAG: DNA-3-methyladenine glycosylase [Halanaeroarchaeum sp.]
METGAISLEDVPGALDLQATLESGQTFRWTRADGETYRSGLPRGGTEWYRGIVDGTPVAIRQTDAAIEWRAPEDPTAGLVRRLRLDPEMATMIGSLPDQEPIQAARRAFEGLRVVAEPFFPTLISFVLSAQMRVERIHDLVQALSRRYGTAHDLDGTTVHGFPEPAALAAATEEDLRDVGLGYRAPYVRETAAMVASGDRTATDLLGLDYEAAREAATGFVGVGEKVADCVLLFSLRYAEPVPLDTWITGAIESHFPAAARDTYAETSRAIRARFGPYPGVTQTYVFHYLRHREALQTE